MNISNITSNNFYSRNFEVSDDLELIEEIGCCGKKKCCKKYKKAGKQACKSCPKK